MKLFQIILVFIEILVNVTKGHTIPKNEITTENPKETQFSTKNVEINGGFDTIINLVLAFGLFFTVVIGLAFLGYLCSCCTKHLCKDSGLCRKKDEKPTLEEKTRVAYHEAGHAIVAFFHKDGDEIEEIVMKKGQLLGQNFLGYVKPKPRRLWQPKTKSQILAEISVNFGGRVAEELKYGVDQITEGARTDIARATTLARDMVKNLGMSEKIGVQQLYNDKDDETNKIFNQEVSAILKEAYERAKEIINEHDEQWHVLAQAILEYETLKGSEVKDILEGRPIQRKKKVQVAVRKDEEEPLAENDANANSVA